jgi:hypothetical protein
MQSGPQCQISYNYRKFWIFVSFNRHTIYVKYSKLSWKKISVGLVQVNWGRKKKTKHQGIR